jgi:hypothetical protein
MMVHRALFSLLLAASVLLAPGVAVAYQDVGFDPDDRPVLGADPDIRRTVRRVFLGAEGRVLRIRVWTYEDLGLYWSMTVRLDTRRWIRPDYTMVLYNGDNSGRGCYVYPRGHRSEAVRGRFRQQDDLARCRVPLALVHPDKRIRWRIVSPTSYEGGITERAPNHGWYE